MFGVPIHKLIIHFPIALTILAAIYDSWGVYAKKPELIRIDKGAVTGHAGFAITTTIVIVAVAGLRYSAQAQDQKGYKTGWLVLEIIAVGLIVATAVTGHRL
jgi:uncharacterized membrane protein